MNPHNPPKQFIKRLFLLALILHGTLHLVPETLTAQTPEPELLKDINPGADNSNPSFRIEYNGKLYFTNNDGVHGYEIWVTDGTEVGTQLLKDINPGSASSQARNFFEFNGKLYFVANDGVHGQEIWVTDGTNFGTFMLKDINPGPDNAFYYYFSDYNGPHFIEFNSKLYFTAQDGTGNTELWVTDGTELGTYMLKDINPNGSGFYSYGPKFKVFNGKLYFRANDGVHGWEVWQTDGTETGTQMLKDINPGSGSGVSNNNDYFSHFFEYNNKLYFSALDNQNGRELWLTDGTTAGTIMLKDINSGSSSSNPSGFILYNGKIYFSASTDTHGKELWETDGTTAGTQIIKDINPGNYSSSPTGFMESDNKLFFVADHISHGRQIWMTDGTEAGTELLKEIYNQAWSYKYPVIAYNNTLYFGVNDGFTNVDELWTTDGTEAGTQLLKEINPDAEGNFFTYFIPYNGMVYFVALASYDTGDFKSQLWVTDGTEIGTEIVTVSGSTVENPVFETNLFLFQNSLYFSAMYDENTGYEPYKLTTQPLSVDTPQSSQHFSFYPNPTDSELFFTAGVPVEKAALYNLQGQLLISHYFQHTQNQPAALDLSGLRAGVYFVKITGLGWEETHKIIKR